MTHSEFDFFMVGTIILCCVMSVFNALKNARKGWPGLILSVAFLVFAGTAYMWRSGASTGLVNTGAAFLMILLCADFFWRAKPSGGKKR